MLKAHHLAKKKIDFFFGFFFIFEKYLKIFFFLTFHLCSDVEFQGESFGVIPIVIGSQLWLRVPSEVTHVARPKFNLF